jgi:pimeloyl-ACP methyl ester carboxylesterase
VELVESFTLADDLDALMRHPDLHDATLVGFSMGGGEVACYVSWHGCGRVAQAVLMSAITPSLKKTDANPEGIEHAVSDGCWPRSRTIDMVFSRISVRAFSMAVRPIQPSRKACSTGTRFSPVTRRNARRSNARARERL